MLNPASRLPRGLISHWQNSRPGLQASTQELYAAIFRRLQALNLPETEAWTVQYREAGIFSAKRDYLQVQRRQYAFDICGAPFGDSYFISWWLSVPVPHFILRMALLVCCAAFWCAWVVVVGFVFFKSIDWISGMLVAEPMKQAAVTVVLAIVAAIGVFVSAWVVLFGVLHTLVVLGVFWAETVESVPAVGWMYRVLISPITYYRLDTALMFRNTVHNVVLEAIEEITTAKGVRIAALTEQERTPTMLRLVTPPVRVRLLPVA